MNIYCSLCQANHQLTPGQAEKVIYALSGEVASALCEPEGDRIYAGQEGYDIVPCPLRMLQMAGDGEGYGEFVESLLASRKDCESVELGGLK